MSTQFSSNTVKVYIHPRKAQGAVARNGIDLDDEKAILSVKMSKTQNPVGMASVELANPEQYAWEREFSNGDLIRIYVNDQLKFIGMLNSVGFSSGLSGEGALHNRVAVKAVDLGILFTKFAKLLPDPYWGDAQFSSGSNLGATFKLAFDAAQETLSKANYDLKSTFRDSWEGVLKPYLAVVQELTGEPFKFSNGDTVDKMFGPQGRHLFDTVSNRFDLQYKMLTQLTAAYQGVWQYWLTVSNSPFTELWADTCYKGQPVDLFGTKQGVVVSSALKEYGGQVVFRYPRRTGAYVVPSDGFRVICRPNPWLEKRFSEMVVNELPSTKIEAVEGTKSAAEVKSMYLVYPISDINMANTMKASGNYALDTRLLSTWGLDSEEVGLHHVDGSASSDVIQAALGKAKILQRGYTSIDKFYAGTVAMRYHDVRVGQKISFPKKVNKPEERMSALVQQVEDSLNFGTVPHQLSTNITYVRGEA